MMLHHAMIASPLTWPALFPDPLDYTGTLQQSMRQPYKKPDTC